MSRYHIAIRLIEEVSALQILEELEEEEDNPESETPPISSMLVVDMASSHPQPG